MSGENLLKLLDAEPDRPPYRLQEQIGFVLRRAQQRHVAIFAAHIDELTPPQFAALAQLAEVGETSPAQLGTMIAMDGATVKGVIDRLKACGLLTVAAQAADKRRLMVRLTEGGCEAVRRLVPCA